MTLVLPGAPKQPSFFESLVGGAGQAIPGAVEQYFSKMANQKQEQAANQAAQRLTGMDMSGLDPDTRKAALVEMLKQGGAKSQQQASLQQKTNQVRGLEKQYNLEPGSLDAFVDNPALAQKVAQPKQPLGGLGGQPIPKEVSGAIEEVLSSNPTANADELGLAFDKSGIPSHYSGRYVENRRRQDEMKANADIADRKEMYKVDVDRASKVFELADTIAETLPQKRTALNLMKEATTTGNLDFFSKDNLAEISGMEGLRSPEGAIFKTASKEYFLGNISRAGSRPNQWIEQQIADMMAKIGRSKEANLSVERALENEIDLDQERLRLTDEVSDRLKRDKNFDLSQLGREVQKGMTSYSNKKQLELFNDLRAIKSIADEKPQKYKAVEKGTPISDYVARAIYLQFGKDMKKADAYAKKLGYSTEE